MPAVTQTKAAASALKVPADTSVDKSIAVSTDADVPVNAPVFAQKLVSWYKAQHRDLPWRQTKDPYHIWLSEIMLQQTQVATVIGYYQRFLQRFPTLQDLAQAPMDDVLKAWEGLGYYARGRNVHKAAQIIVAEHHGKFPKTLEAIEQLPGIGRSTAGAILTFAFGDPHPILDGNVKRVLARLLAFTADVESHAAKKQLWAYSQQLLNGTQTVKDAYAYNQAVMELGATVCLPKQPRCLVCPVQEVCQGAAQGIQHELPRKPAKKQTPHYPIAVGIVWNDQGQVLIQQRPAEGLLGGLWEFPGGKQEEGETLPKTVQRELAEELGIQVTVGEALTPVKHAYTHFKITLHAFYCQLVAGTPTPKAAQQCQWVLPDELRQYAFPKANNRVIDELSRLNGIES